MTTKFYEILVTDLPAHQEHFLQCHQQNMPGNQLAIIHNAAGDRCLVKVNCDEPEEHICGDCPVLATYSIEQVRELLTTPEWIPPTPVL